MAQALARGGVIYENEASTAYVQRVMDRLFPEFKGHIQVAVVKSPQLNAFALPNGRIYVNQGLLVRFRNEAQLATVLGHEGIHFTNRHGYQEIQSGKDNAAFGAIAGMVVPLLPQLMAVTSIYGFSRQMETEADVQGFARLKRAGYDVRESPKVFEHLIAEIKAEDIKEPYFFASHPKLVERVENMKKLSAGAASRRRRHLERELCADDGAGAPGQSGEACCRRTGEECTDHAQRSRAPGGAAAAGAVLPGRGLSPARRGWRSSSAPKRPISRQSQPCPNSLRATAAMGVLRMKANHYVDAQKYLERYVELAPSAPDLKYVESYLRIARKKAGGQP